MDIVEGDVSPFEVDLTRPHVLVDNPLLARKAVNPGRGGHSTEGLKPVLDVPPAAPAPEKTWVLPSADTKVFEKPLVNQGVPGGTGTAEATSAGTGLGGGDGSGEVDWIYLTEKPRLLNLDEILRDIRKYYPEEERRAGREGEVILDIHLDEAGRVVKMDVTGSAGAAFDIAARRVMARARFSPARAGSKVVPVKMRQPVAFLLEG